jgi:SAM-dependent methyltransferase
MDLDEKRFRQREKALMEDLAGKEYLRQRIAPKPGDPHYLCLSDLLIALKQLIPASGKSRVLDFGCGGSPYRTLFRDCTYHRADLIGGRNIDFEYGRDSRLPPAATAYDLVLSTQVLEHVQDPLGYLRECNRVLIPGGHLLLTTHGLFEDHACPHDFWRWTAFGLQRLVEDAGLEVNELKKLTTGPRGAVYLTERELHRIRFNNSGWYGHLLSLGIRAVQGLGLARLHEATDQSFRRNRMVDASESGHDLYIVIAVLASRPNR